MLRGIRKSSQNKWQTNYGSQSLRWSLMIVTSWDSHPRASQVAFVVKNPPANAGKVRDTDSIPGSGRSPREGHGSLLQYSCLENPMDRGAWWITGSHRVRHNWALSMHTRIPIHVSSTLIVKSELVCVSNKMWHKWWYVIQKLGYKSYGASTLLLSCELWRHSSSPVEKSTQRGTEASSEEPAALDSPVPIRPLDDLSPSQHLTVTSWENSSPDCPLKPCLDSWSIGIMCVLVTSLLCPWDSPGKNIGVGSHSLLQGIFPTQWSNLSLLHWRWILYHLSHHGSPLGSIRDKKWFWLY